jgi:hypothetical protein
MTGAGFMENLSRTIRFKKDELDLIEKFLAKNPFFDFSSLTRIAVVEFVKNPPIQIVGVQARELVKEKRTPTRSDQ